jgi:hypothetical protein
MKITIPKSLELKIIKALKKIKRGLKEESYNTKEMLTIYYKSTHGEASDEDIKKANKQFRNFLKSLGIGTLVILPFAPITLPFVVKVGQYFGIDIIPDSFKDEHQNDL